jgi:hypothetical protein
VKTDQIRSILALLVVGVFMAITGVLALWPVFSPSNVQLNEYADFFNKTAGIYTGIVGVVIGYYFGRSSDKGRSIDEKTRPGDVAT